MSTPTADRLKSAADYHNLSLTDAEADALTEQFSNQDTLLAGLESLNAGTQSQRDHWEPEDDPLGAWLSRCDVSRTVDGPLAGLSVGIKDNVAVAGVPMTCGSPLLTDPPFVPNRDATVVSRLLNAGARIIGKTNMDEFAFGGSADSLRLRMAYNPHDRERQPGSSSVGSGIAAATGEVDLAVGSDTGGSVRFPAAWCGVPGIKPTRGLVSHNGFVQFAKTLDNVGFLAPSIENLALGLEAVAGADPRDGRTAGQESERYAAAVDEPDANNLAIALPEELFGDAPDLDERVYEATDVLEDAGATISDTTIESYDLWLPAWLGIGMTEVGSYLRSNTLDYRALAPGDAQLAKRLRDERGPSDKTLGPSLKAALLYAEHRNDTDGGAAYALAHEARRELAMSVDEALEGVDVLASPTVPMLPPRWDEELTDLFGALANTGPFNVTGHPAVSVPCGAIDGLPVGLQFVARRGEDATALRAAAAWMNHSK